MAVQLMDGQLLRLAKKPEKRQKKAASTIDIITPRVYIVRDKG